MDRIREKRRFTQRRNERKEGKRAHLRPWWCTDKFPYRRVPNAQFIVLPNFTNPRTKKDFRGSTPLSRQVRAIGWLDMAWVFALGDAKNEVIDDGVILARIKGGEQKSH